MARTEKIPCPRSLEAWSPLSDYTVHTATQSEIDSHGGVCRKCREQIEKHRRDFSKPEQPVTLESLRHTKHMDGDHAAWTDGHGERFEDFDYDRVDRLLAGLDADDFDSDSKQQAGEVLAKLFCYIWAGGERTTLKTALARLVATFIKIRPDLIGDRTYADIGREIGCGKANIQKAIKQAETTLKVRFTATRTESARQHMSEAMRASWGRRKAA